MCDLQGWLALLEQENGATSDLYLWPRTPIANIQAEMWCRVGVSDWRAQDSRSRTAQVLRVLTEMVENNLLHVDFTFLDICCGDAIIDQYVARGFGEARVFGVDLLAGRLEAHTFVQRHGVQLYRVPIQTLFQRHDLNRIDVAMMLNTYRGWGSADLHEDEEWLPGAADDWFFEHCRYVILTVTPNQRQALKDRGFWVRNMGPGEDKSEMVLCWPCDNGDGLWQNRRP